MNTKLRILALLAIVLLPAVARAQGGGIDPTLDDDALVPGGPELLDGSAPATPTATAAAVPAAPAPDPYELQLGALARRFDEGVEAWRRGEYAIAEGRWLDVLAESKSSAASLRGRERILDRHALLHNLGNAAFRLERPLEAMGWYLAALRHAPRSLDTRANLALARRAAELDTELEDDFAASVGEGLDLITPSEARWLALLALGPLLVALLGEAVRGGRAWRLAVALAVLAAAAGAVPLAHHSLHGVDDPVMVVRKGTTTVRAEPLEGRPAIGEVSAGEVAQRIDELPDWVRIERRDGTRGWLARDAVFPLVR
ncbi:SH3 domain-containing protein [Engelhardtia mirabilis]|uniref:SH3b domain-containing protein n=1 Tax=Engelhardtia mirabilis TaxID=2528011 RepID=A0A518BN71_9BACT|nr:hypothetical protein Pla133_35260 [Planctomycetes bacterium Pla133]QDV02754.1 hypothetical protein Pla86_35240 [Planctomycetes bacterium Pla86]